MCIAIVKTKGATVSDEALKQCWTSNPDGAGFAYPFKGNVAIEKGFFKFDTFLKRYKEVVKQIKNDTMLIHFRISTSGLTDKNNCHPHRINNKLVMIHNGILHIDVPKNSKVSDTVLYCNKYLKKLPDKFEYSDILLEYISDNIGTGNKFCFLNNKGDYAICNEKQGTWDNGVWYSNSSYKEARKKYAITSWGNKYSSYWNGSKQYDDDDYDYGYYSSYVKSYGYGKVIKYSAYANLTDGERLELQNNEDLYEDIWEAVDNLDDQDFDEMGDSPYVNLLLGTLASKDIVTQYNSTRYMPLGDYDDYLYGEYMKKYRMYIKKHNEPHAICNMCGTYYTLADIEDNDNSMKCKCGGDLLLLSQLSQDTE